MAVDLVIDVENTPGALARVAAAISDAGVNIAAATCIGPGERAELHILVKHAEAARHALAISHDVSVSHEREVVVVEVQDRPGVLADLTRKIARAGVDLDLVYVATQNRVVFGAPDLAALRAALDPRIDHLQAPVGAGYPARGYGLSSRMTRTGRSQCSISFRETLPSRRERSPEIPCEPTTTTAAPSSRAMPISVSATSNSSGTA